MKFVHLTSLTFCFAVPFAKIEHGSVYDESLRRSPRVNWPDGFEEACILQPCDEMTFFEVSYLILYNTNKSPHTLL